MLAAGCKLSMDGRGAWRDKVFVERVYLHAYDSVSAARTDIADYLNWYNAQRPDSRLDRFTPDEKYFGDLPQLKMAA